MDRLRKTADDLVGAVDEGLVQPVKEASLPEAPLVALERGMIDVPARLVGALFENTAGTVLDAASWIANSSLDVAGVALTNVVKYTPITPVVVK